MFNHHDFWLSLGIGGIMMALSVLIHYEGLYALGRVSLHAFYVRPKRMRVVLALWGILMLHILEIWLYGGVYWLLAEYLNWGSIVPTTPHLLPMTTAGWTEYIYLSIACYTSLGFGDIIGTGALTMLTGVEALNGLILITWSASFTYLLMEKLWNFKR